MLGPPRGLPGSSKPNHPGRTFRLSNLRVEFLNHSRQARDCGRTKGLKRTKDGRFLLGMLSALIFCATLTLIPTQWPAHLFDIQG